MPTSIANCERTWPLGNGEVGVYVHPGGQRGHSGEGVIAQMDSMKALMKGMSQEWVDPNPAWSGFGWWAKFG